MLVIKAKEKGNDKVLYLVFRKELHLTSNIHLLIREAGEMLLSHKAKNGEYIVKFEEENDDSSDKGTGMMIRIQWNGNSLVVLPKEI